MLRNDILVSAGLLLLSGLPATANAQTSAAPAVSDQEANGRAIAERIAALLETNYLYPDTGRAYAATMRERAAAGAYDGLAGRALADRLTLDLLAVRDDAHLRVRFGAPPMQPMPGGPPPARVAGPPMGPLGARPPAIEQAGWIAPGIAFIRFNEFPPDPAVTDAVRAFLHAHANAKTLIFDLRTHRGGGPAQMDAIFPTLFATPVRLAALATREGVDAIGPGGPAMRVVKGAPGFVTREHWAIPAGATPLQKARVFVLTSAATGSAGEHFAAALKWTSRATLIGTATAGANHFGSIEPLGGGLTLFVPVGRTFNPADGKDWEGSGIAPDIAVPADQALAVALIHAGLADAEATAISARYRPSLPMERPRAIAPR